jgi:hypothetical protein
MEKLTRRLFLRRMGSAGISSGVLAVASVEPAVAEDDDGPLLADDVTGTTAFADWHERKYGFRPVEIIESGPDYKIGGAA